MKNTLFLLNALKLPTAPAGFIRFKWKTAKTDDCVQYCCPNCGAVGGQHWQGGGWQDPEADALYETHKDEFNSFDVLCQKIDGVLLKCHWSRFGMGHCEKCGVEFWHDFGGNTMDSSKDHFGEMGPVWNYYWRRPTASQLEKSGTYDRQLSFV